MAISSMYISGYDGMMVMIRAGRTLNFAYSGLLSMWINPFYYTPPHHNGIYIFFKSSFLDRSGPIVEGSVSKGRKEREGCIVYDSLVTATRDKI